MTILQPKIACIAFFLIQFTLLSTFLAEAQTVLKSIDREKSLEDLAFLRKEFSENKEYPPEMELAILTALSYYPELKKESIQFKFSSMKANMAAAPKLNFLFRKKKRRSYVISMANNGEKVNEMLPMEMPFNAQIGVIGHELGHILDYKTKRNGGLILFGLGQMSRKFKSKTEKPTDIIAIDHGLGWQLYELREICLNQTHISEEYLKKKDEIYLLAPAILEELKARPKLYGPIE